MTDDSPLSSLERLQRELIAVQRHALLGAVSTILVHEYNNLLQPVLLRAEDALRRDDHAAMRRALEVAVEQSRKALLTSEHLMGLANGRRDAAAGCVVAKAIRGALNVAAARPFEKDRIEVQTEAPEGLTIAAPETLVEQVLLNLLLDARASLGKRGGRIRVHAERNDDAVLVRVSDDSHVADAAHIRDVINPFLASDPRERPFDYAGVGVTLNACRTILRLSGATLSLSFVEGAGRTYTIRWPASA